MQQHQPITINQHFIRHNSNANSVIINSPPSQTNNLLYPPPQRFPVRPSSSHTQRPPLAHSFVSRPNHNYVHLDRELQLDRMAKAVSQHQQSKKCQGSEVQRKSSREKNNEPHKIFFNSYSGNGNSRHPEVISTSIKNTQGSMPLIPDKDKTPSPYNQPINQPYYHQVTQHDFKLQISDKRGSSIRQSKTDRENPQKSSLLLGYSNTPEAKSIIQSSSKYQFVTKDINKGNRRQLQSTITSSIPDKCLEKKQLMESNLSTRQSDYIIKRNSPINFWPLSISPSEQKRQSFILDQLPKLEVPQKAQINAQDNNNNQFKKKKNFQFLRNLRKKFSNASTLNQPSRTFQISDFQLMDKIGKGAFGDVYMAQEKNTGFLCVIKKLQKKKLIELKLEEQLAREIKIQSFLQHRHLTSLYGFFSDQAYIYLILELMPDGSLMQVKKKRKIPESQVSYYLRQICLGLKYMHNENVIHRDIKPQNIFLNDTYAKIGDFGCSIFTQTNRNTQIGSFAYISPEQLKLQSYNEKIDVWSLGVMTYEMLLGNSPFQADIIEITKKERAPELSQLTFPQNCQLSQDAKRFLVELLNLDPQQRLGIDQALRHDFIQKYLKRQEQGDRHPF